MARYEAKMKNDACCVGVCVQKEIAKCVLSVLCKTFDTTGQALLICKMILQQFPGLSSGKKSQPCQKFCTAISKIAQSGISWAKHLVARDKIFPSACAQLSIIQ